MFRFKKKKENKAATELPTDRSTVFQVSFYNLVYEKSNITNFFLGAISRWSMEVPSLKIVINLSLTYIKKNHIS